MRRDHFTLTLEDEDSGASDPPSLAVAYEGPAGNLTARLDVAGDPPGAGDVDASYRLQEPIDADDPTGVFGLTTRLTGEYLLETHADVDTIQSLVDAARDRGGSYRVRLERPGAEDTVLEKETLLVYDADGNLRRTDSLIPSGIEL